MANLNRTKRRGAAIIVILLLTSALFLLFAVTFQSFAHLKRQNMRSLAKLQERASKLKIVRDNQK